MHYFFQKCFGVVSFIMNLPHAFWMERYGQRDAVYDCGAKRLYCSRCDLDKGKKTLTVSTAKLSSQVKMVKRVCGTLAPCSTRLLKA